MSKTKGSVLAPMAENFPSHEDLIDDLGNGPLGRNLAIWDEVIEKFQEKYYAGMLHTIVDGKVVPMLERYMKIQKAAHMMMKKEFMKLCGDTSAGIAVLDFVSSKLDKGQVSVLILFHNGKVNLVLG